MQDGSQDMASPHDRRNYGAECASGPQAAADTGATPYHHEVKDHRDGHGLNESIIIHGSTPDPKNGNASHLYMIHVDGAGAFQIQFQHGPRGAQLSKPGITSAVLLAVLIDHLRGFQSGPFACRENAIMLTKLEETLHWTKARADDRARRGVLGKTEK